MAYQIKTEIRIDADPALVWKVFSDFESYPKWNPFVRKLSGQVAEGSQIKVELPGMNFAPKVLAFRENLELRWRGHLLFKGLFDGEHYFQLVDNGDGSTTFIHGENFKGLLVGLFKEKLETETAQGFKEMNEALKQRVEA